MLKVIAIDGPAGSGKSTVARTVAQRLGLDYLDTGAMYRSVALAVLRRGIDPTDEAEVAEVAGDVEIIVGEHVVVDGEDATAAIRTGEVDAVVSVVAANPAVREQLVVRQRAWAGARGGGVIEGRDIGTVVFPDAVVKVYLTASEDERVRRRSRERGEGGTDALADAVAAALVRRDTIDSTRPVAPLARADDALLIDTTGRTVEEVVDVVLGSAKGRME